jgi:phospholipase C
MGTGDADAQRLRTLKHIVVLMMENRSFDHMLGYLKREGMDEVDGLTGEEFNLDTSGRRVHVHAFDAEDTRLQRHGEALQKRLDPDHSPRGVQVQLGPGYGADGRNGGFVKSFLESRDPDDRDPDLASVPMGYYTSKDVPVYDHLARQYCVCDRWYASIPGDTWPNRMYALTGEEGPKAVDGEGFFGDVAKLPWLGKRLRGVPLYDGKAFTRQLRDEQWHWYSHDPATLRAADPTYRDLRDLKDDNFSFFDRAKVSRLTKLLEHEIVDGDSFLDDAARNRLAQVSWIDPNFYDVHVRETVSNDDHPPSDIRAGQAFVLDVYDALRRSPEWEDTLLIVTYDEHGGFFDHHDPPKLPAGDPSTHGTYGLRVPALIVGPRVRRQVLHEPIPGAEQDGRPQFDHTSLIKTILLAFAEDPEAAVAAMPPRVQAAPHLGSVLLDAPRHDVDEPRNARSLMALWRQEARERREALKPVSEEARAAGEEGTRSAAPDGAGQPQRLTDFQEDWLTFALALRQKGVEA